jgi:hypothetical protein
MKTELVTQLTDKYPKLFEKVKAIYCGDGWYNLIDITCNLIQVYADRNNIDPTAQIVFTNISEQFGRLRLRYQTTEAHEYVKGVTEFAERMSTELCELSGERGSLHRTTQGHAKTLSRGVAEVMLAKPIIRADAQVVDSGK